MNQDCTDLISGRGYGFTYWHELFTNRQLTALTTFSDLVVEAQGQVQRDGGSAEYAQAVGVYLGFGVSRMTDINNALCRWEVTKTQVRNLFTRQAIPMVWDFSENNVFGDAAGGYMVSLNSIIKVIERFQAVQSAGIVNQHAAQADNGLRDIMISTDPPYYDNIGYADLSDFFYIWLRQSLKGIYRDLFRTMLVPKSEELVATPYRFEGSKEKACTFFERGMLQTFKQINIYAREDVPVTVYYAYKQSEDDGDSATSTGWETMLSAIIEAGFSITGTWPKRTELSNRMVGMDTNALASSIVLVCRKCSADAPTCPAAISSTLSSANSSPSSPSYKRRTLRPWTWRSRLSAPAWACIRALQRCWKRTGRP
jgi:putative DNA methylase